MKFDEIGQQIFEQELTQALHCLSWQVSRTWNCVTPDLQANTISLGLTANQYFNQPNLDQVTLITKKGQSLTDVINDMQIQQDALLTKLTTKQLLWPLGSGVTQAKNSTQIRVAWPEKLAEELFEAKFKKAGLTYLDFRNQLYLKVAQQLIAHQWFVEYLFGANPYDFARGQKEGKVAPKRNSCAILDEQQLAKLDQIDYHTIKGYLKTTHNLSCQDWVKLGCTQLTETKQEGILYLEIQTANYDDQQRLGIGKDYLKLMEVMIGYFLMIPGCDNGDLKQILSQKRMQAQEIVAQSPYAKNQATQTSLHLLEELNRFATQFAYFDWQAVYTKLKKRINDPQETPAAKLLRQPSSILEFGKQQALKWQKDISATTQKLDTNSQKLLQAAILNGITYQILLAQAGVLQIGKRVIVKGIQTEKNSAPYQQLLQYKQQANRLAQKAGFYTLQSWEINNMQQAHELYSKIKKRAVVVKSALANAQQQAHVFRLGPTKEQFIAAVSRIHKQGSPVLVEQVVSGSTYRALIADKKVVSIVEKIPANVVGDGRSTLEQLLAKKQYVLDEIETETLKNQGIRLDEVIPRGIQVLLRYDASSNTKAQYLEVLDEIDQSYLTKIVELAESLHLNDGGIDVILPNLYQPYDLAHPELLVFLSAHTEIDYSIHENVMLLDSQDIATKLLQAWKV